MQNYDIYYFVQWLHKACDVNLSGEESENSAWRRRS